MKKFFLPVLTAAMIICAAFAPAVQAAFTDVEDGYEYKDAISCLTGLHVVDGYEDNTFKPLDGITRAEFTKMLICAMGYNAQPMTNIKFTDVSGHWAESYITAAVSYNVVSGFDDGTFKPDDSVTYEQCLTMLDRALGYENDAVMRGGYPDGYINVGASLGITSHVSSSDYKQSATRGMVAQLIYNSLEVPLLGERFSSYPNEGEDEHTFLNTYLKLKKLSGIVVGVEEYITNDCTVDLYPGQMDILSRNSEYVIDFSEYTQNVTDMNKYLGHTVTVYYREPNAIDDRMLAFIDGDSAANSNVEIFYKNINSYKAGTLKYYDNGVQKSFKINPNTTTIRYNGRIIDDNSSITLENGDVTSLDGALTEWFDPDGENYIYGDVTLSVSSDNTVKVVQINNYKTIVALRAPSSTDYKIMDKLVTGNSLVLDPNSIEYTYTLNKGSQEIPVTSIAANDVILYAESLDGELYTVIDTANTIKGTVTSFSGNGETITIDGKKYDLGEQCEKYIADNQSGQTLKNGVSGTFYLDKYDTVVFATITEETAAPYAYIANAFMDEGTDECFVTVFESAKNSTSTKTYKLKSKVKFNGSNTDDDRVIDRLGEISRYNNADEELASDIYGRGQSPKLKPDNQSDIYSQVARVGFDGDEVSSIVTLDNELEGSANESKQKIVRHRELGHYQYRSNSFSSNGTNNVISTNSSTVVLCVPQDRTNKTGYAQKSVSSAFDNGESYYVEAYDVNSSKIAGLVILYSGSNSALTNVTRNSEFAIVADYPTDSTDSSGSLYQNLPIYWGPTNTSITTQKTWATYEEDEFSDVEIGDVIQFAYNADKQIQGRINNIRFRDIEKVLDKDDLNDGLLYDWTERVDQASDPNHQTYKFDYRFKTATSSGDYNDEMYTSSSLGNVPYARACMYNVMQIIEDTNQIYVTKHGFDEDGLLSNEEDYEVITVSSSTKFLRMDEDREGLSPYAEDGTTTLSKNDLLDVQYYGSECSKVLICSQKGEAKLIVIYR